MPICHRLGSSAPPLLLNVAALGATVVVGVLGATVVVGVRATVHTLLGGIHELNVAAPLPSLRQVSL